MSREYSLVHPNSFAMSLFSYSWRSHGDSPLATTVSKGVSGGHYKSQHNKPDAIEQAIYWPTTNPNYRPRGAWVRSKEGRFLSFARVQIKLTVGKCTGKTLLIRSSATLDFTDWGIYTWTSLVPCVHQQAELIAPERENGPFFSKLNLRTNNFKSNALNFCLRQREIEDRAAVMADDVLIEETDSTKFLGMYLNRNAFRELGLLTLPCLYILDVALYCRFKCEFVRGRYVYQYGTRGRDNLRLHPHRTAAFKRLPSEVGVKLINKLPDEIKNLNEPTKFKARLRHFGVEGVLFSGRVYDEPLG
ncbi:hypothetical protein J6590_017132 [Homalodisca vitripennis]|nr:hypothetical protein J6590_017132 [Homalodisca vitripennis]